MTAGPVRRVVVVGGGIAGVSMAAALRDEGFTGEIVLVDAGKVPYDRPPLSKDFLAGKADLEQIALQPPRWYAARDIRLVSSARVTRLLPGEGAVELDDGSTVGADRVVLAMGGRAALPPVPGLDSPLVHTLRSVEDAERLRAVLRPGTRLLVIGAGLIGAEVASTARLLGADVTLVDPVERPLAQVIGDEAADLLHGMHKDHGIRAIRSGVSCLEPQGELVEATLTGGSRVAADAVLVGVGMVPAVELAADAGLRIDRGVVVDQGMTTTNPAVLAVGDLARVLADAAPAEHWDAAQSDARRAAATILGKPQPPVGTSWFWTDRHGHHVEVVGKVADGNRTVLRRSGASLSFFGEREGLLTGAVAIDDPLVARAARRLIDRAIPIDPGQLADPATDLRKLIRR